MKKRILSVLLIGLLSTTVLGCNTKNSSSNSNIDKTEIKVTKEEAFETVPEDNIMPKFVYERYQKNEELLKDYEILVTGLFADNKDVEGLEETAKKYNIDINAKKCIDAYNCNPDFYKGLVQYAMARLVDQTEMSNFTKQMVLQAQNYLAYTLMGEKNDVVLAPEFKELNPKEYIQKYLKDNDIEITNIVYPQDWTELYFGAGSNVMGMEVTIEGTQNGKEFNVTKLYNFHYTCKQDIREGASIRLDDSVAIIGVTDNCFKTDYKKYNNFNVETFLNTVK